MEDLARAPHRNKERRIRRIGDDVPLGHLEELRSRLLSCQAGIALSVVLSFTFTEALWDFVKQPAKAALIASGQPPQLMQTQSMEVLTVVWFKLPLVCAVFLASPWCALSTVVGRCVRLFRCISVRAHVFS